MITELAHISLAGFASADLDGKRNIARKIDAALQEIGFFIITDHGVPAALIDETVAVANAFFDRPMDEKMSARSEVRGSPRGYIPFGLETLSRTAGQASPPDLKEGFGMGPDRIDREKAVLGGVDATYTPNRWPAVPAGFRPTLRTYYAAMETLTNDLMELFAIGMDLDPDFFVSRFTDHNSTLRLINYPPPDVPPMPGQLRAGAHTDYGALTILLGQDKPGGLQVRTPAGCWIDAKAPPYAFIINIGDLMMTWSNDTWLSNVHRVVNPPDDAGSASRRLSIAYFCNPNDALLVECLPTCCGSDRPAKYPPIRAGEHRYRKIELSKAAQTARS